MTKWIHIPGIPDVKMRPRFNRKSGHAYDPNAESKEASIQKAKFSGDAANTVFVGPLKAMFNFVFPRPKSHYRSGKNAHLLKHDAPKFCTNKKDIDNLIKFYSDTFNSIAWVDDCQIVSVASTKRWAEDGDTPHVHITVWPLEPDREGLYIK